MKRIAIGLAAILVLASPASAKTINVKMLTTGPGGSMVFDPPFVKAAVGDTIHFIAQPTHNAELIAGMAPAGVPITAGKMNQSFDLKLTKAGIYGIKCKPHFAMGMVAVIQAGNGPSPNLAAAKAKTLPGLAAKRMTAYLAKAK